MDHRLGVDCPGHRFIHRDGGSSVEVNRWKVIFWLGLGIGIVLYTWTLWGVSHA